MLLLTWRLGAEMLLDVLVEDGHLCEGLAEGYESPVL